MFRPGNSGNREAARGPSGPQRLVLPPREHTQGWTGGDLWSRWGGPGRPPEEVLLWLGLA